MNVTDRRGVLVRFVCVSVAVVQLEVVEDQLDALVAATFEDEVTAAIVRVRLGIQRRRDRTRLDVRTNDPTSTTYVHT